MAHSIESLKLKLIKYGVFASISIAIPIIALICPPFVPGETQASWFQRSGSVLVVAGVIVEYKLLTIGDHFDIFGTKWDVPFDVPKGYSLWYKSIGVLAAIWIILGTFIWGYGDIPFRN